MDHWTPTTYLRRFGDVLTLLCAGHRPTDEIMAAWLDTRRDDLRLQEFACEHGPVWAQGIAVIDAARVLADQPTEGVKHEITAEKHYPEEWGPSDNRRLTCVCGDPDPFHATTTPNAALSGAEGVPLESTVRGENPGKDEQ